MAGENNETEGTEPKTFKENFTDFAKNLGSSLNVFKQNVQNAIDGVNTIATKNKETFQKYWAREDDSEWGNGEVLSNYSQLGYGNITYIGSGNKAGDIFITKDIKEVYENFKYSLIDFKNAFRPGSSVISLDSGKSISLPDLNDFLTVNRFYEVDFTYSIKQKASKSGGTSAISVYSASTATTFSSIGFHTETGESSSNWGGSSVKLIAPFNGASDYAISSFGDRAIYLYQFLIKITDLGIDAEVEPD